MQMVSPKAAWLAVETDRPISRLVAADDDIDVHAAASSGVVRRCSARREKHGHVTHQHKSIESSLCANEQFLFKIRMKLLLFILRGLVFG
jgi:hypothetical protein